MLMPPPQLKTGITSAFHQTSLDKDDMDVAYEKPTLANLPPSPHARVIFDFFVVFLSIDFFFFFCSIEKSN